MSLIVHMPLNGNTNNYGLSDIISQVINATVDNNGYIGKCYSFTFGATTQSVIKCNADRPLYMGANNKFSIAFYVYCVSQGMWSLFDSSYNDDHIRVLMSLKNNKEIISLYAPSTTVNDVECPVGEWCHFVFTYDGTNICTYKNGVLSDTKPAVNFNHYYIKSFALGGYEDLSSGSNIKLNDFRFYDHCLSQKEINELKKCLLIHYPLNNISGNTGSENLIQNSYDMSRHFSIGTGWTKSIDENDGATVYSFSRTGSTSLTWNRIIPEYKIPAADFTDGVTVSFDFMCDDLSALDQKTIVALQCYNSSSSRCGWVETQYVPSEAESGKWIRVSKYWKFSELSQVNAGYTGPVTYTTISFQLVKNGSIHIKKIKLEYGNKTSDWSPHKDEFAYSLFNYGKHIIEDVSGYNNHTFTNGNFFEHDYSSPRYSGGSRLLKTSFDRDKNLTSFYVGCRTICYWLKPEKVTCTRTSLHGFELCRLTNGTATTWTSYLGTINTLNLRVQDRRGYLKTFQSSDIGKWFFFAFVINASNKTISNYVDGELKNTATVSDLSADMLYTDKVLYSAGWGNGTGDDNDDRCASMSDFRVYGSQLSSDDIRMLYVRGASINKQGELYCGEIKEDDNRKKQSVCVNTNVLCNTYIEEDSIAFYDGLFNNFSSCNYFLDKVFSPPSSSSYTAPILSFRPKSTGYHYIEFDMTFKSFPSSLSVMKWVGSEHYNDFDGWVDLGDYSILPLDFQTNLLNLVKGVSTQTTVHIKESFYVDASLFNSYDGLSLGISCTGNNGSGTLRIYNVKIYEDRYKKGNVRFFKNAYINATDIQEI